ncbi:TPA: hypothetical protein ACUT5X_000158 [Pseudomonas aeruginosa]
MSKELNKALDLLREIRPSIPKDVLELWCKDRDAFLASHKAPVEQAGGDERKEFEAWMHTFDLPPQLDGETFADERYLEAACFGQFVYDDPLTQRCWAAWQARAALAQPSPKCATCNGSGQVWISDEPQRHFEDCPDCAQPSLAPTEGFSHFPELLESVQQMDAMLKAEAERPEVVAWQYRVTAGPQTGWSLWHPGKGEEFERSYTVERRPLMTVAQHERIVGELRAVIAQLRQHKNDYMDSGQETYRALQNEIREREAEIARLDGLVSVRTAERDAALARVEQQERTIAGMNEAHAKLADLYEAAQTQHSVPVAREQLERLVRILDAHNYAKDAEALMALLAAAPAQAQHSVPEGWRIERSAERIVVMNLKNGAGYAAARDGESGIAESVLYLLAADLLAAAPGKEVGHE